MRKNSFKTFSLVLVIVVMLSAIVLLSRRLAEPKPSEVTIQKTTAATRTYTETLALNANLSPSPSSPLSPSVSPETTQASTASTVTPTIAPSPTSLPDLSPTEIIIAQERPIGGASDSAETSLSTESATATPSTLPESGITQFSIALFAIAALVIFLSFIY